MVFWDCCGIGLTPLVCELIPRSRKILSRLSLKKRLSACFQPAFLFSGSARKELTAAFRWSAFLKSTLLSSNIRRQKSRDNWLLFNYAYHEFKAARSTFYRYRTFQGGVKFNATITTIFYRAVDRLNRSRLGIWFIRHNFIIFYLILNLFVITNKGGSVGGGINWRLPLIPKMYPTAHK